MKILCFSADLNFTAPMAHIRLIAPFRQAGIEIINGLDTTLSVEDALNEIDVVLFQRELPINYANFQNIINIARKNKKPIVFEIDDLLFFLPKSHPDYGKGYGAYLLPMFQALIEADFVSVSSPMLRQELSSFNPNIHILPNYFDDSIWKFQAPKKRKFSHDVLTLGFMGSASHQPDLKYILPVLLDLLERYTEKIRVHFWGAKPPSELLKSPQVKWTSKYFYTYTEFTKFFQTQSVDIFLAPLIDNLFNRCKSSLKFFEYSALGASGVYSRLDPYEEIITHRQNGLLASTQSEWQENLIELIENDNLRFQLALNAQSSIKENWLLSKNSYRWKEFFHQFQENPLMEKIEKPLLPIIRSLNTQQEDLILSLRDEIKKLKYSPRHLCTTVLRGVLLKCGLYSQFFRKSFRKKHRS